MNISIVWCDRNFGGVPFRYNLIKRKSLLEHYGGLILAQTDFCDRFKIGSMHDGLLLGFQVHAFLVMKYGFFPAHISMYIIHAISIDSVAASDETSNRSEKGVQSHNTACHHLFFH